MQIFTGESLAETLSCWGIACKFNSLQVAPQITKYYFDILQVGKLTKLKKLVEDLALITDSEIKLKINELEAGDFSLEFINKERLMVGLNDFSQKLSLERPYSIPIGVDENGNKITATLDDLTHLLVAGTTGSGKSVCLNSLITGICCYNPPDKLGLILIDVKQVEFNVFAKLPHLMHDIITTTEQAEQVLNSLVEEMERRYSQMRLLGIEKNNGEFRKILVVIDELCDLVLVDEKIKTPIIRLLQKARACGIHLILSTQSPRAKVLDGLMLANLPSRIALTCSNYRESVLIIGKGGCEKLTGKGDAYFKTPQNILLQRIQAPYISREEIKNLIK